MIIKICQNTLERGEKIIQFAVDSLEFLSSSVHDARRLSSVTTAPTLLGIRWKMYSHSINFNYLNSAVALPLEVPVVDDRLLAVENIY